MAWTIILEAVAFKGPKNKMHLLIEDCEEEDCLKWYIKLLEKKLYDDVDGISLLLLSQSIHKTYQIF